MPKYSIVIMLFFIVVFIGNTQSSTKKDIKQLKSRIQRQITYLNDALDNKQLRNALLLDSYAKQLKKLKPELRELADSFGKDARSSGPAIQTFQSRLDKIENDPKAFASKKEILLELKRINQGLNPEIYNDSLLDLVNAIADLSGDTLKRVQIEANATDGQPPRAGSQLVGNPGYGSWQNRNGSSMWIWFAAYTMLGRHHRPYYYGSWHYNRPWSYYNDYGRGIYSSGADRQRHTTTRKANDRQVKSYGARTGRRTSTFQRKNARFRPSSSTRKANVAASRYASSTTRNRPRTMSNSRSTKSRNNPYASSHRRSTRSRSSYGGK
jgi:hypothetical protein